MMKRVFSGKSVEDAVRIGLSELGVTEQEVAVTVLTQASKGLFGLIGVREAKVELTIREPEVQEPPTIQSSQDSPLVQSKRYLADVIREMGIEATIEEHLDEDGHVVFNVTGKDLGIFIGRRGQTLDAIQLLVNAYMTRVSSEHTKIVLDAEQFRKRRRKTLQDLSLRLANQVIRTKKEVVLEPMPSHDRRIIHSQLQQHPKVKTFSKGEEPNRRIVITLK